MAILATGAADAVGRLCLAIVWIIGARQAVCSSLGAFWAVASGRAHISGRAVDRQGRIGSFVAVIARIAETIWLREACL